MSNLVESGAYKDLGNGTGVPVMLASSGTANPVFGVLTRPADTTAYAVSDLVASSTTAGSVAVPSGSMVRVAAGSGLLAQMNLYSSHTTGLSGTTMTVRLWSAAPTYTNGDNGAYAVATGAASFIAKFSGTFEQFADGAVAVLTPNSGTALLLKLAAGQTVYWDLQTNAIFTPQSGATFTLVPQIAQD
jgi:hypothetical protein